MGMFSGMVRRGNTNEVKGEDDLTSEIKGFFEEQKQENYTMKNEGKDFSVTVDGDVHIYKKDLNKDGTLDFKLDEVTGNLICHVKSISPDLVPDKLGGCIIFDVESIMTNPSAGAAQTTEDDDLDGMEFISDKGVSDEKIEKIVLAAIYEAEYNKEKFGIDYNINDILKRFNSEKSMSYNLEIKMENVPGPRKDDKRHLVKCDIYITDSTGKPHKVNMKAQEKAVYLLFLLHKNGIKINEFVEGKKNYNNLLELYENLQENLYDHNTIDNCKLLSKDVREIKARIRSKISDITQNKKYIEKLSIEGYKEGPLMIEAATDEQRELVIETFECIDWSKYDLK